MKTRKRFLAVLLSLFMIMTLLPVSVGAQDALTVTVTPTGSSQTVLTSDESITAETEDTALLTLEQTDANTVTAAAVSGAVGIAEVTVSNASGGTKTVQVPVGYTTFAFAGDTLTVYPGSSSAYEISGINVSDAAYTPTAETMADGSLVYTNTDEYSLCVEIKKSGGTFVFTGESDDMSIAVKKEATGPAVLLLNGLTLASSFTSPVTVKKNSSSTVTITALAGSVNTLSDTAFNNADVYGDTADGGDGSNAVYAESAVIKAKAYANLTLNGSGTLNLVSHSKNAVKVGEYGTLTVEDVDLHITSDKHGISADNTMTFYSGAVTVDAAEDGIRSDPDAVDADAGCAGNILIYGGTFEITAGSDGIQAAQDVTITGGTFQIRTGAGYSDTAFDKDTMSCKGIKASYNTDETSDTSESTNTITITGGTFVLNTADDALHSDGYIVITGGTFQIQTGDDGVHADTSLTLGEENGDNSDVRISVLTCYEGLEAGNVYIYSGVYKVWGSDDGINAAGDGNSEGFNPGGGPGTPGGHGPGGGWGGSGGGTSGSQTTSSDYAITIYGGKIYVNVDGDGLDANGNLNLYGGNIVVWGQAAGGDNEPLDCDGSLLIKGATVFAAGSKQMTTTPASGSQSYVRSTSVTATAGKTINVKYSGSTIYNITAEKSVNYVLYSSPDMASSSYSITVDTSALIETDTDPCEENGHTWDSGVYETAPTCTETGTVVYTCTVCGKTKTTTASALGHSYVSGYCTRCGAENPNTAWYTVTFVTDGDSSVSTFLTQDTSTAFETNAQTAYARNSDTGLKDITGDGQCNFAVTAGSGYTVASVTVTEGAGNYKNLKVVDAENGIYRITKITGNLTVTVTTISAEVDPCADGHTFENGYCTVCGEEDPDAVWYTVTFVTDGDSSVSTFLTQDTSTVFETNAQTAYARNSDTGLKDITGDGQCNFAVNAGSGYVVASVTVTEGTGNYKNLKVVDAENGIYRITKITGDLTVTVATQSNSVPGDANDDGAVDLKDAAVLKRYLAGGWDVTINEGNADVNEDGSVDLTDVALILRFLAGWNVELK